ncbi:MULTISPECIES: hypothetical protein [Streptomyces]|uniref:hypothetical protein n=1 Tax=Streptomyces TaxID=1883 RepID=UPI001F0A9040|nr:MULTISPECIES: hypothetical protein [Streptomyces]
MRGRRGTPLAGCVAVQSAAWAVDALLLYVAAYALDTSIPRRFTALPVETFRPSRVR